MLGPGLAFKKGEGGHIVGVDVALFQRSIY